MNTTESTIQARKEEAAARLGVDVSQVDSHKLQLREMRENGLLLDMDVHGISMAQCKVTFAELGIGAADVRTSRMRTGHKDLFPENSKKLRSLEARARANLTAHSFRIAQFGGWSWMPWTAYDEFKAKHDEIVADLEEAKAEILARYDEVYEENLAYFQMVADKAWCAHLSGYGPDEEVMVLIHKGPVFARKDKELFVDYIVQQALSKMPLREEIVNGIRIAYRTSILYGEAELLEEEAVKAQAEKAEAQTVLSSQAAKIEAIKQAELEHARAQLSQMGSPLTAALDQLQASIYDAPTQLLEGLQKNDGFKGRASEKAAGLLSYWKKLNGGLLQDKELEAVLGTLDGQVRAYGRQAQDTRDVGQIIATLNQVAALSSEEARKIRNVGPSRASALEI